MLDSLLNELIEISDFLKKSSGITAVEISQRMGELTVYSAKLPSIIADLEYIVAEAKNNSLEKHIGGNYSAQALKIKIENDCKNELKAQKFADRLDSICGKNLDTLRSQLSYLKSLND